VDGCSKSGCSSWTIEVVLGHGTFCDRPTLSNFTNTCQTDGKEGKRDYELKDHEEVRLGFEKLFTLNEVARAMVIGYASQNPFSIYGKSEYQQQQEEKKKMLEAQYQDFVPRKSKKENVGAEIDMILQDEERRSAKAREQEMGGQDV